MSEFVLKRGLKNIYAAEILTDDNDTSGYTTGTPFHLIPAGEMSRTVDSEKQDIYYDDTVFATIGREAATEISITGAALRADALARINNKDIDATTGAVVDSGEYAPKYFALGGEAENTDGTTEWFWFLKGTFSIPEQNDKTKDDTTDTNGMTLTFSAVQTQHIFTLKNKVAKRVVIDTAITEVKSNKSWTEQVVTPDNLSTICQKITPATTYTVTNTLTNVTTSNAATSATSGSSYTATLTLENSEKTFDTCTVTMGGTDVTSTVVSGTGTTRSISIASVTGNVVITATQST